MIYLLITIITSVLIIICFKVFHNLGINAIQAITFNYLFGFIYGSIFSDQKHNISFIVGSSWLWPALLIGIIFIVGFILFSKSTEKAGVSITAVSSKMSVVIPVVAGFILFNDTITITKVIGIVLALISFYFVFKSNGDKIDIKYILLPMLLFLTSGLNDLFVKYIEHNYLNGETLVFVSVVFLSAFFLGLIYMLLSKSREDRKINISSIIGGFILGSFNFWNAWAFVKSMSIFESSALFPIINVSVVSIAALSGALIFKEKLKLVNWFGIIMAVVAILLISISNGG